jgi:hypothetical protein
MKREIKREIARMLSIDKKWRQKSLAVGTRWRALKEERGRQTTEDAYTEER